SDEFHGPAPLAGPTPHRSQQVAITAAEIDECQRLFHRHILGRTVEPTKHRPMPHHRTVEACEISQNSGEFGALDLTIENFRLRAAARGVENWRRPAGG